jgi:spoIIIJ-associated protein
MRYEGKSEAEAVETASREIGRPAGELRYRIVRDEKSFWGGRVVEIEVEEEEGRRAVAEAVAETAADDNGESTASERGPRPVRPAAVPVLDDEAWAAVETSLTELLSAAGFLVELRRKASNEEMVFELIGDDVEGLLANKGEGLNGLEVLAGRIASRRLGRPVHPRLDAEGFRRHQKETLEDLAHRSAEEAKRTRRPQLLPPLSPAERRLVHLALAEDPEVETESEGSGFLKRVAVRVKAR